MDDKSQKMSFDSKKKVVEEGDVCIVFMGHDSMLSVQVKTDDITQTKFGAIKHNQLIGHKYGTKFHCSSKGSKLPKVCLMIFVIATL